MGDMRAFYFLLRIRATKVTWISIDVCTGDPGEQASLHAFERLALSCGKLQNGDDMKHKHRRANAREGDKDVGRSNCPPFLKGETRVKD